MLLFLCIMAQVINTERNHSLMFYFQNSLNEFTWNLDTKSVGCYGQAMLNKIINQSVKGLVSLSDSVLLWAWYKSSMIVMTIIILKKTYIFVLTTEGSCANYWSELVQPGLMPYKC